MKNSATDTTSIGDRLLSAALWELSLLGHKTIDVVKMLLQPGSRFRSLPHVRILLVLSMLVLIFDQDVSFSIGFGDKTELTAGEHDTTPANAGVFSSAPLSVFSSIFSLGTHASSTTAFAKTDLTVMDSQTGTALINRFKATAIGEQTKLGVDAGVLLATAIAAGAVQTPEQVANTTFTTNYFGEALDGSYPSAWASWRAMCLSIMAVVEENQPTRDEFVLAAASQFPDVNAAKARIYEALRFYQL